MKESIHSISKDWILYDPLNDEFNTRKISGIPTSVSYSQGQGTFDGAASKITYPIKRGVKSVRIKIQLTTTTENILQLSATHNIVVSAGTITANGFTSPTIYVDGAATATVTTASKEIIVTTATAFDADDIVLGYVSSYLDGVVDLFGLSIKELTASQISNLFNNRTYHELPDKVDEVLGSELVTNGGFDTDTNWSKGTGWTISGGKANCDGTQPVTSNVVQNIGCVVSKTYRIIYTISNFSAGSFKPYVGIGSPATNRASNGTFTEDIICAGDASIYLSANSLFVGSIDNVSVKEVISGTGIEKILDNYSLNGINESRIGLTPTNTALSIHKIGQNRYVSEYDGSTSKSVFGNIGVVGSLNLILFYDGTDQSGIIDLDGTNTVEHAGGTLAYWGDNAYINGVDTDTLSMGWNFITIIDNSGTAASAFQVGYDGTNYFKGMIGREQCFTGNLSIIQHSQFWSNNLRYFK